MVYQLGEYRLDPEGILLTCQGRQIDVTRKVLVCITHLVLNRDRIVPYDELIRVIWRHADISNNQLSQVILTARRILGDDGHAQRLIKTMPGVGYRWTGDIVIIPETSESPSTEDIALSLSNALISPEASLYDTAPPAANPLQSTSRLRTWKRLPAVTTRTGWVILAGAALSTGTMLRASDRTDRDDGTTRSRLASEIAVDGTIASLRKDLYAGDFEKARIGLAMLPPAVADSPEAGLIAIDLDIRRGRFSRAAEKLAAQKTRAEAAADPVWQARLLVMHSELNNRLQLSGADILAPAHSAIELLEASGARVPDAVLAEALWRRANGLALSDRFAEAQHDLIRASDLYQRIGDDHRSTDVRVSLARVHMRMGRLSEALDEMRTGADDFRRFEDRIREIFARNTMSKIQIELLRWEDALTSNDRSMELLRGVPDSERRYPTLQLRALALTGTGRLREAAAMLEEADSMRSERRDHIIPAIHHLEAGDFQAALDAASREFESTRIDTRSNLLLENKDGVLLLWMTAAQGLVAQGKPMPPLSEAQLRRLNAPESASARAARGRWLMIQGRDAEAETELRRALEDFGAQNQIYRMTLVVEPLIDALLRRGDAASARDLLVGLRARAPEHVERDYRATLLQLRLALAQNDRTSTATAYRKAVASGLERRPPDDLLEAYRRFETQGAQATSR